MEGEVVDAYQAGRHKEGRREIYLVAVAKRRGEIAEGREGSLGGGARRPGTGRGVPAPPPFLPLSPNLNLVNLTSQFLFLLFLFSFASSLSLSLSASSRHHRFFLLFYLKAKNKRALLFLLFIPWNIHQAPNPECSMTAPSMPLHVQTLYGLQT